MANSSEMFRLKERLRVLVWRWFKNAGDAFSYLAERERLDPRAAAIVQSLRENGIVLSRSVADPELLQELYVEGYKLLEQNWDANRQQPRSFNLDHKIGRSHLGPSENKDFLIILTPKAFEPSSIFLRYALQSAFMQIASAYLGQYARLRAVQLWLNYASPGEAASTQLWHRDDDDLMNVKIFTYLSDVDESNGPFAFIPGTQPLGRRVIYPKQSSCGRSNDVEMAMAVPVTEWKVCTGSRGDVIISDTCGLHKGVKPREGYRLMLMVQYTSGSAGSGIELFSTNSKNGIPSE